MQFSTFQKTLNSWQGSSLIFGIFEDDIKHQLEKIKFLIDPKLLQEKINQKKFKGEKGETINAKNFLKFTELKGEEVEIFIRTGGEKRVSNFLLPNIGYSELFFSDKLWPDFNAEDFNAVLDDFKKRQRRFGK